MSDPRIVVCKHSKFVTCRYCTPYYFNWEDISDYGAEVQVETPTGRQISDDDAKFQRWKREFLAQCKDAVMLACEDRLLKKFREDIMNDLRDELNDVLGDFRKQTNLLIEEKMGSIEVIKNQLKLPLMSKVQEQIQDHTDPLYRSLDNLEERVAKMKSD